MNFLAAMLAVICLMAWQPALASEVLGQADAPVAGRVLGAEIRTRDAEALRYYVLKELTGRYAQEQGITVSPEEIDAYVRHVQAGLDKDLRQREARRDELAGRLAAGTLNEAERGATSAELETLNELIAALNEMAASANQNPQETVAARQQVATAFILQWKINRALHRHYGGRIGFQQGGAEPLDAHYAFLRNREARGDFTLLDEDLAKGFWRYYLTDSLHSFFARGSPEAARAFDEPPWLAKQ